MQEPTDDGNADAAVSTSDEIDPGGVEEGLAAAAAAVGGRHLEREEPRREWRARWLGTEKQIGLVRVCRRLQRDPREPPLPDVRLRGEHTVGERKLRVGREEDALYAELRVLERCRLGGASKKG